LEKKTPLYEEHVEAGARMVPFGGYVMPLQYAGIIPEHRAVREKAGLFDLSHMGEFRVSGPGAVAAIDRLVTNDIAGLDVGQIRYTPMTYPDGGIVDDLLVYRFRHHLLLVVNAANIEKDFEWISSHLPVGVELRDESDETALIAIQGPSSQRILQSLTDSDLSQIAYYHFTEGQVAGVDSVISRTGYTGEDGFELYVAPSAARAVWKALRDAGSDAGLALVGLGARDTLRLESAYMLYGNDIDATTSPLEAGLGWTVKFGQEEFVGQDVIESQKASGPSRRLVQVEMLDRAIPRPRYMVWSDGEKIGELTSGTFSPTFGRGLGLGYVRPEYAKPGTELEIEVRGERHPARVVKKPLYRREGAR
jgi:aminomethyltransferase